MRKMFFLVLLMLITSCYTANQSTVWLNKPTTVTEMVEGNYIVKTLVRGNGLSIVTDMYIINNTYNLHLYLDEDKGVVIKSFDEANKMVWTGLFIANTPYNMLIARENNQLLWDCATYSGRMYMTYFDDSFSEFAINAALYMYEQKRQSDIVFKRH